MKCYENSSCDKEIWMKNLNVFNASVSIKDERPWLCLLLPEDGVLLFL